MITSQEPIDQAPLHGLRVIELFGQGPGPYGAMLLADLGADVVAVVRPSAVMVDDRPATNSLMRGKRSVAIDLKQQAGVEQARSLLAVADVFIDPFRPGVCERLGIGPDEMLGANDRLIYARMTGYGQSGPLARAAGHDINYIAVGGALHAIGHEGQPPTIPLNLLGDFAGGGLLMAMGIAAAAFERERSGRGQVIDVAMVDGVAALMGPFLDDAASGIGVLGGPRGTNLLDGGAPFYNVYETSDGRWVAVGAIEPQFFAALLAELGIDPRSSEQMDRAQWRAQKARFANVFRTRTRDEWTAAFDGKDACVTPVLAPNELVEDAHIRDRQTIVDVNGVRQAAPVPRFARSPARIGRPMHPGSSSVETILQTWS